MENPIIFNYTFRLDNGTEKTFDINLDPQTLSLIPQTKASPPGWAELSCCQCPNCPLDKASVVHCPVALNVADAIGFFQQAVSHEEVEVTIRTRERTYSKRASLQVGLSSLLGIYMVTSGCPILDKLKPMVRFHLPFANAEETQYRVLSMYLLAQFFVQRHGGVPDWGMTQLPAIYREIQAVNRAFCNRMLTLQGKDAVPNAVVVLDNFAQGIAFNLDKATLDKTERLFAAYFKE